MKKVGIIIPCYNEEKIIKSSILKIKDFFLCNKEFKYFIVSVNDGSTDKTQEILESIKDIHPISYSPNKGKGGAIKEGLKYCFKEMKMDYAIFMDADLSTKLNALPICLDYLEQRYKFVITSRHDKDSVIEVRQPLNRRFISKCSRIIIGSMFHFKVKDTQCGFKGFSKDFGLELLRKSRINGFSFDVEFLYIAKLNHYRYVSFPVIWSHEDDSKVSGLKTSFRFFKDLFKIKRNKKYYRNK